MPNLRTLLLLFLSLLLIRVSAGQDANAPNFLILIIFLLIWGYSILKFLKYLNRKLTYFRKYGRHLWWYHFRLKWRIARERWQVRQLQRIIDQSKADLDDNHDLSQVLQNRIMENIEHWKNQLKVHRTFRRLYEEERLKLRSGRRELLLMQRCRGRMNQRRLWRLLFRYYVECDPLERFQSATQLNQRVDLFARERLGKDTEQLYHELDLTVRREQLRRSMNHSGTE